MDAARSLGRKAGGAAGADCRERVADQVWIRSERIRNRRAGGIAWAVVADGDLVVNCVLGTTSGGERAKNSPSLWSLGPPPQVVP